MLSIEFSENSNQERCGCITITDETIEPNGNSLLITNEHLTDDDYIHKIIKCDIKVDKSCLIDVIYQYVNDYVPVEIFTLIEDRKKSTAQLKLCDNEIKMEKEDISNTLSKVFDISSLDSKWILKCFKIDQSDSRILEIGIKLTKKSKILLGALAVQKYSLKRSNSVETENTSKKQK